MYRVGSEGNFYWILQLLFTTYTGPFIEFLTTERRITVCYSPFEQYSLIFKKNENFVRTKSTQVALAF